MIDPFPQDWELVGLFEREPALLVPGVPWAENRLIFEAVRESDRVACEIEPAGDLMVVRWWQGKLLRLHLDLRRVRSVSVLLEPKRESLIVEFRGPAALPLEFQIRPSIALSWGTAP